ncbi:major facilitator superfamily domain-containing protein [Aspergillus venezuelensis]
MSTTALESETKLADANGNAQRQRPVGNLQVTDNEEAHDAADQTFQREHKVRDNTIVADIQPQVVDTFGSKTYAQLNAKWLYLLRVVLFEVGSAMCGAAPTMNVLIGGRALAGLGGAGLYVGVMTQLSVNTTKHERPMYIGMPGLAWGAGTVLGPIVGGGFAVSKVGWRWSFYINLLFAAITISIYNFMIPPFDPRPGVTYKTRFAQLDYLGTILMIGASVAGVMVIKFGGQVYPWNSGQTIFCFVVSGILFIVFGLQQAYCFLTTKANRTFPCKFVQRLSCILFAQIESVATIFFKPIYFVRLFFQFTRSDSDIDAGVRLLLLVCFVVPAIFLNDALMSPFGYYMPWYLFGELLSLIETVLMYTINLDIPTSNIYGYRVILGIGGGIQIPVATGFLYLAQLTGRTIALVIANCVFLQGAREGMLNVVPHADSQTVQQAVLEASSELFNALDEGTRLAVLGAASDAISWVYILPVTAAVMSIALAGVMSREKLFLPDPDDPDAPRTAFVAGG